MLVFDAGQLHGAAWCQRPGCLQSTCTSLFRYHGTIPFFPIKSQHGILSMAALQTYREFCRKIGKGGLPPLDGQRKIEQELNALENGAFS